MTCSHFIRHSEVEYHSKDDYIFPTECVSLFVCLRAYLKNHTAKHRFMCISTVTMVQSSNKYSSWVVHIRAKSAIYDCLVTIVYTPVPFPFLCPPLCQNSGAARAQCKGITVTESFCIGVAVFQSILEHQCGEWRWGRPLSRFHLFVPKLVATATSFECSEKKKIASSYVPHVCQSWKFGEDQSGRPTFWDDWSPRGPLEKEIKKQQWLPVAEYRACSTGRPDGWSGQMSNMKLNAPSQPWSEPASV